MYFLSFPLSISFLARGSRPKAALIPYDEYLRFQTLKEQDVVDRFDRLVARIADQNAAITEEEVAADVATALDELTNNESARPLDRVV